MLSITFIISTKHLLIQQTFHISENNLLEIKLQTQDGGVAERCACVIYEHIKIITKL